MYINFTVLEKFLEKGWKLEDLLYLCATKNKDAEHAEKYNENKEKLIEAGFVKLLKDGSPRLDKKGTDFLNKVSKSDRISPETEKLSDWITNYYKKRKGGIVRNKAELKRRCEWYSNITGISGNALAVLVSLFINDVYDSESGLSIEEFKEQNPRMVLNNMAENIFWKPNNHFSKNYTLEDSPLYEYFEANKKYVETQWKRKEIEV